MISSYFISRSIVTETFRMLPDNPFFSLASLSKRNFILDSLNIPFHKDNKRQSSNYKYNDKDILDRFKVNQNKIKDKIKNFV